MPDIQIADRRLRVSAGSNLLDELLAAGLPINYSCRSGHCQSCLVRSQPGAAPQAAQASLSPAMQAEGWLLACQCNVQQDLHLSLYDPATDGLPAHIEELTQLNALVLRLRVRPARALRFHPGQHLVIWLPCGTARTFSIASQAGSPLLEFHLQQRPGSQFGERLQHLGVGAQCYLGSPSGHLHYQPDWQDRPLLLLSRGTGLAPLQAIARDALQQGHTAGITLWHWQRGEQPCYLQDELEQLAKAHPNLQLALRQRQHFEADLQRLRVPSRRTLALACGSQTFVERLGRPLFMAGLSRTQVLHEVFTRR
ncbi:2Fe-2S iron-sulfur cluster-binding protein [Halopseudomonas maritima]|uniref:2Fe-2S iron-sulfur cluster-binding protein n=1 Tax=Halopseudomonas maritima TaxID=2918528 RepID=UPI001EE9D9E1|nr:2Fe-2S iron-sulfur cluster-binding protein [Halopseudomonas maritima]UJJ31057.1 2Fe-2S iron-sulfur cluster binding domain-containing protein [Halopseudomonas maritima]